MRCPSDCRFSILVGALIGLMLLVAPSSAQEIGQSVGRDQINQRLDVMTIQVLLNQLPPGHGGPSAMLVPDGIWGPKTSAAWQYFQTTLGDGAHADKIDPDDSRWQQLRRSVAAVPLPQRIQRVALGERLYWGDGPRSELDPQVSWRLKSYWAATGLDFSEADLQDAEFHSKWPWSAAFVSWVMQRAASGDDFHYSEDHWRYVAAAKANRQAGNDNPFQAYDIADQPAAIGDVVVKRRSDSTATYANIERGHKTHGDVVVAIEADQVVTIGGNVSDSVRTTPVAIGRDGRVTEPKFFAIVKVDP